MTPAFHLDRVSAPGRICLFGEHQDYLRLPVIAMAISLRIQIEGKSRPDSSAHLELPDIRSSLELELDGNLKYMVERDYFRSAVNVLRREGFTFGTGVDCIVRGNIPINAGTSSSSALVVSWISLLALISDQQKKLNTADATHFAHLAEVVEFSEPGGMMDHCTAAYGGTLFISFEPNVSVEPLQSPLKTFVLGDSLKSKDTKGILGRVRNRVVSLSQSLAKQFPGFSLFKTPLGKIGDYSGKLSDEERDLLVGTVRNRDMTRDARSLSLSPSFDHAQFGTLLNEHQSILRDVLNISTKKIDRMLDAAMNSNFGHPGQVRPS